VAGISSRRYEGNGRQKLETKATGSEPVASNCKRCHGSSWTVATAGGGGGGEEELCIYLYVCRKREREREAGCLIL
jgi:hypothetical protein